MAVHSVELFYDKNKPKLKGQSKIKQHEKLIGNENVLLREWKSNCRPFHLHLIGNVNIFRMNQLRQHREGGTKFIGTFHETLLRSEQQRRV